RARRDRQRLRSRHLPPRQAAHVLRALREDVPLGRVAPLGPEVLRGAARRERLEEEEGRDRGAYREGHAEHGETHLARRVAGVLLVRAGALDWKGIAHVRRSLLPGFHVPRVLWMTGQKALPVLIVDGETIHDSTRIIERLERLRPEPALYPADDAERRRALALEDFFDEELGPD